MAGLGEMEETLVTNPSGVTDGNHGRKVKNGWENTSFSLVRGAGFLGRISGGGKCLSSEESVVSAEKTPPGTARVGKGSIKGEIYAIHRDVGGSFLSTLRLMDQGNPIARR